VLRGLGGLVYLVGALGYTLQWPDLFDADIDGLLRYLGVVLMLVPNLQRLVHAVYKVKA